MFKSGDIIVHKTIKTKYTIVSILKDEVIIHDDLRNILLYLCLDTIRTNFVPYNVYTSTLYSIMNEDGTDLD